MSSWNKYLAGFAIAAGLLAGPAARAATDPQPGDLVAPPVNVNIGLFYNYFSNTGQFGRAHGPNVKQNVHFSDDVMVARLIHIFSVDGYTAGVQAFVPYVSFFGGQHVGVNLPSAATGLLPPIGPGRADFSHKSALGQPNFSAFIFPINNPLTGTYAVVSPWISPPVSGFDKTKALNAGQNVWTYEMELGYRTTLFGTPTTRNLSMEIWGEGYLYGTNSDDNLVTPTVTANNLPPIYAFAHQFINPAIPGGNPIAPPTSTPATFREQPSAELRVYFPYQFLPATRAFIAPGFYQSFGGKQTFKLHANGAIVDSGNRTNESQLRLMIGSFVAPNLEVVASGYYDIAAHGAPLNRTFLVRLALFF